MFIWPQKDGPATWTGSFNQEQWDAYQAEHPAKAGRKSKPEPTPEPEPADHAYDPADYTVPDVVAYLEGADEDEQLRVLEAETAGKGRVGITGWAPALPDEEDQ